MLDVQWEPIQPGGVRETLHFKLDQRHRLQAVLCGTAVAPAGVTGKRGVGKSSRLSIAKPLAANVTPPSSHSKWNPLFGTTPPPSWLPFQHPHQSQNRTPNRALAPGDATGQPASSSKLQASSGLEPAHAGVSAVSSTEALLSTPRDASELDTLAKAPADLPCAAPPTCQPQPLTPRLQPSPQAAPKKEDPGVSAAPKRLPSSRRSSSTTLNLKRTLPRAGPRDVTRSTRARQSFIYFHSGYVPFNVLLLSPTIAVPHLTNHAVEF